MREKVEQLVAQALADRPSLFLIDLTISNANQIRVVIDGDKGVSVQDCMDISRAVEHNLDREAEDFSLEVFSAGVSEPLTIKRQYEKNLGRSLKVKTNDDTVEGELFEVTEDGISLKWKTREPKPVGKGKRTVQKEESISFENIVEAKVMIKFN